MMITINDDDDHHNACQSLLSCAIFKNFDDVFQFVLNMRRYVVCSLGPLT